MRVAPLATTRMNLAHHIWPRRTVLAAAITLLAAACTTVPITGRSQLRLLSNDQLVDGANQAFERFMTRRKTLLASESPQAAHEIEMVNRVSDRIIEAAGLRRRYNWETVVIKSSEANAFVLPNGKIVVFRGLLPVANNEVRVAAVIGHEVGHLVAQHAAERITEKFLTELAIQATDIVLQVKKSENRPLILEALGLGAEIGVLLPFSRTHEAEADYIGLILMAKAGYNPSEALGLWERMEAKKGSGLWEFLSTHPSPATRRDQIRQWLPRAMAYYAPSPADSRLAVTQPSPGLPALASRASSEWEKTRWARVISRADIFLALPEFTSLPSFVRTVRQGQRLHYMGLRAPGKDGMYLLIRDANGDLGWVNEAQVEPVSGQ